MHVTASSPGEHEHLDNRIHPPAAELTETDCMNLAVGDSFASCSRLSVSDRPAIGKHARSHANQRRRSPAHLRFLFHHARGSRRHPLCRVHRLDRSPIDSHAAAHPPGSATTARSDDRSTAAPGLSPPSPVDRSEADELISATPSFPSPATTERTIRCHCHPTSLLSWAKSHHRDGGLTMAFR